MTEYFSDKAQSYADARPGYPDDAIAWILSGLPAPARAVDVGCGTGISTRALAKGGAQALGVEPNAAMLAQARSAGGDYRQGTAEATGLPGASADLVLCAQAFHWFDAASSLREFHRLLVPGGRLALMWNVRDESTPFGTDYAALVRQAQDAAQATGRVVHRQRTADPGEAGPFTNVRRQTFDNPILMDWERLQKRAFSTSYFPDEGLLHERLVASLRGLFERHGRDGHVVFAQRVEVTLTDAQ